MVSTKEKNEYNIYQIISFLGFLFYLPAVLCEPSGPQWGEKLEDVSEMSMSTPINQIVYSTIFILAFLSILPHYRKFFSWLNNEKYIIFFLVWCGITIFWAIDPIVAFKRYFQYLTTSLVFISTLLNFKDEKFIIKALTFILSTFLLITLIVVLTIPQATDPSFNTWRGLHPTKNNLGQTASLSMILFAYQLFSKSSVKNKIFFLFFFIIALILLIGSFSITNILLMSIFTSFFLLFKSNKIFEPLGIRNKVVYLVISFALISLITILTIGSDIYLKFFDLIGKDPTLTGRTDIWYIVLSQSLNELIAGFGFQSFWVPEHLSQITLFQYWIPTQSHNGYVDLILETGFVGLILFLLIVFSFFKKIDLKEEKLWALIVIYTLLLNFSESTLIRPHHYTNVLFYLSFWVVSYKRNVLGTSISKS